MPTTDQELVNAILSNDSDASREAAWKAFIMQYKNLIYRIAVGGFRFRYHDADDVFQEVCVKLVRALRAWQGNGKLSTFVAIVTKHACIDKLRGLSRRQEESLDVVSHAASHLLLSEDRTPEEVAQLNEQRELVGDVIGSELSERDAGMFRCWVTGSTYEEIAAIYGITVNNVGVIVTRSKTRVAEAIRRRVA